ncbi:hypothetical protein, partial [Klebsiella pneumoniae]|uniref:hypothetical protein n=1 Tax=Klebsiella pneumoniae TaxID=573 RepID=UPI0021C0327B
AFLRVEVPTAVVTATMVERGEVATEFEPFCLVSPDVYAGRKVKFGRVVQNENSLVFGAGVNLFGDATNLLI